MLLNAMFYLRVQVVAFDTQASISNGLSAVSSLSINQSTNQVAFVQLGGMVSVSDIAVLQQEAVAAAARLVSCMGFWTAMHEWSAWSNCMDMNMPFAVMKAIGSCL